jgi:hypothetical protein
MKIGFILECSLNGPDALIYPWVAKKICPHLEIEKPETMGNKKNLITEGPVVVQALIETGCDFVFIIWDRMPKWEGGTGKCEDDVRTLEEGLKNLGIDNDKVVMCCINEMLESWLIVDGQAITDYFQGLAPHVRLKHFGDNKDKASQASAKNKIKKYNGRYNDFTDNFKIVKLMKDFEMPAKWNHSFGYFKNSVEDICAIRR